ncbi:MAG TPA: NYN domain-containing protein [Gemmatales bacterium]|nr:NYN domain-containing protein [Gemmatales bacterium]
MFGDTYLFIDGGYLKSLYRDLFTPLFGENYRVDYRAVLDSFSARRGFLYDCLDDAQKLGESEADFKGRVKSQEEFFDEIDKVEGVHVRYGYLTHGKKRQQKEVDVTLAVDMLTHAFYKNMNQAVLLSGDRDFRPVVESVVRLGILVKVAYDPRTGSRPLARAADNEIEIDISTLCDWINLEKYEERRKHFPVKCIYPDQNGDPFRAIPGFRLGVIGPEKLAIGLCEQDNLWHVTVQINQRDYCLYLFHDRTKLFEYLAKKYGTISL